MLLELNKWSRNRTNRAWWDGLALGVVIGGILIWTVFMLGYIFGMKEKQDVPVERNRMLYVMKGE